MSEFIPDPLREQRTADTAALVADFERRQARCSEQRRAVLLAGVDPVDRAPEETAELHARLARLEGGLSDEK